MQNYPNFNRLPYEETYNNDIQSCNSMPTTTTYTGSKSHMDDLSRATSEVTNAAMLNKCGIKPTVIADDEIELVSYRNYVFLEK
jgi:hypothetical protein